MFAPVPKVWMAVPKGMLRRRPCDAGDDVEGDAMSRVKEGSPR